VFPLTRYDAFVMTCGCEAMKKRSKTGEIFGDVPNIAARAQALADPGSVVVTARVQRQIAGLFVVEERGSHELKGVPEPVTLYRIVRASGAGRRAGQRHLTPLVGRDEEIALLMRRWDRARQGDGQLVLIVGEPALGTSKRSNAPSHVSQWMTGPMLRKLFNISAVTLWRWRRRSGFPRGKSINGRLYIPWHEVEAWLQSQPEAA
jgi:predicted DNA-binding transcriptional regulator AlpA